MNCLVQPIDELRRPGLGSRAATRDGRRLCLSVLLFAVVIAPVFAEEGAKPTDSDQRIDSGVVLVEGQITNATGGGLTGADVRLFRTRDWPDGQPIASTATDRVGDFAIRVAESVRGKLVVVVSKERFTDLVHRFEAQPNDRPEFIGATLDGDLSLSGRVVDKARGVAVAKADVRFTSIAGDKTTRTDDDGRFAFHAISPGSAELTVQADGFGREHRTFDEIGEIETALVVELKPDRTVTLHVVDDRNKPIRGAVVECLDPPRDDFRSVTTDADGRAVMAGMHFDARRLRVRLSHTAHVSSTGFDREIELPADAPTSTHTLVMQPAGSIGGHVVDAATGEPVYGARVITGDEYSDSSPRDWTDTKGGFTISGVAPGTVTVTVHAADRSPDLKTVSVQSGARVKVEFALGAPGRVAGHIKNKDGAPVVDAEIVALRWREAMTLSLRAITDSNGAFVMRDAPRDGFDLAVMASGFQILRTTIEPGASAELDLTLDPLPRPDRSKNPQRLGSGDDAPDFRVTTLDGERVALADLKGKYVVLDFWATWCAPCVDELPTLASMNERYGSREDFVIVSVSRDFAVSDLRGFLRRHKEFATWRHVVGPENGVEETRHAYGVSSIPRVFIIGPGGKILDHDLRGERFLRRVDEIMADAVAPASESQP